MIRQLCRDIARVFGGQGGVRNFGVIFIVIAGLLLSCCLLAVAVANGGTPGRPIAQATATPKGGIVVVGTTVTASPTNTATATPSSTGGTVTPSPTSETPTQPTATNTPAQPTATNTPAQPTATNTPAQPTATNTPSSSGNNATSTPTQTCQPSQTVPCGGPGTGGGPGSGPQSGVENGGTLALILVGTLSLVLVAVAVVATWRIRRARGA